MVAFCFSLVLFALFYLLKLKWGARKRAYSVSFSRLKLYADPVTKKTSLEEKVERQQTCRKSSFPAPVPNLGCDIEQPMQWTDYSGATPMRTLMSTTSKSNGLMLWTDSSGRTPPSTFMSTLNSKASSSRDILRPRNFVYRSTLMSTKIRANLRCTLLRKNLVHGLNKQQWRNTCEYLMSTNI
ncbi:hypothetical protein E1301_Tti001874 [Triplophysa tibetana]|uniref:Uncharacterized protein n=1 Tax=Triplophysa tibetana TaxID=1572043 RepID=A0A5A9PJH1_9TELE|nr:hypothetical protein E1301_Tti001874 [Triplophysa tibetana]